METLLVVGGNVVVVVEVVGVVVGGDEVVEVLGREPVWVGEFVVDGAVPELPQAANTPDNAIAIIANA